MNSHPSTRPAYPSSPAELRADPGTAVVQYPDGDPGESVVVPPMKILFVTPYYYPELQFGGPPKKMHALSSGLVQRGHQVRVITFHSQRRLAREVEMMDGVEVQYLPWIGQGLRQFPLDFKTVVESVSDSNLVHGYGLYDLFGPLAAFLAHHQVRPHVLEPLGMYVPRASKIAVKKLYNLLLTRRMANHAARVVVASSAERSGLLSLVGERRLVVRRNGIDLAAFAQLPPDDALRLRLGLRPEEKIILYMGRISPVKNLKQLAAAFGKAGLPDTRLLLAGPAEPDYLHRLQRRIKLLNLQDKILLTGPLYGADRLAAFGAADLLVLPSLSESFGNAAAEAVAAGLPVLLTDTCGIAAMIHGRAGLAVPLGEDSISQGLLAMMDETHRRKFAARGHEVRQELSWDKPIRQTEELYHEILQERLVQ